MKRMALALLAGAATCASAHYFWEGPTYPPYGGATFGYSGEPGQSNGRLMTLSGLQLDWFHDLAYGVKPGSVYLSLTGSPPTAAEQLHFIAMSGPRCFYSGFSDMTIVENGQVKVLPRIPIWVSYMADYGGSFVNPADIGLGLTGDPILRVDSDTLAVRVEAFALDVGQPWFEPYLAVYNRYQHPQNAQAILDVTFGFFQTFERQYSGQVVVGDYIGSSRPLEQIPFQARLLDLQGNEVWKKEIFLGPSGGLDFMTVQPLRSDSYELELSGGTWLVKKLPVSMNSWGCLDLTIPLINGDIDQDNAVTVFDYGILSDYFDRNDGESDWTTVGSNGRAPRDADLDGDGAVTVFDYGILSDNFDKSGD